jgi:adenylyltransferase/sulfurtransferase
MDSRYSRQEVLGFIGRDGQKMLASSSIAIVGCGALGSVTAELLARAGIGNITIIDHDVVELSNLQRQALYTEDDVSKPKASCLKSHLGRINSEVKVTAHDANLNFENILTLLSGSDLVLDCTDNIDTRLLINEFCVKTKLPWIHSAAVQEKGVIINFLPGGPCFKCVFPKVAQQGSCEELGILNSTSHITASIQVTEALKILLKKPAEPDMLRIDSITHVIEKIKVKKLPSCNVCAGKYELLEGKQRDFTVQKCKTRKGWSAKPAKNIKLNLADIRKKYKVVMDTPILLVIDHEGEIIVHDYGELLFKDMKDEAKIRKVSEEIYKVGGAG